MNNKSAIIVCPIGDSGSMVGQTLLGLTIGERVLLALQYAGVSRVAFVGDGPKPTSNRARVETVPAKRLLDESESKERGLLVLSAHLVFDRKMVSAGNALPASGPLTTVDSSSAEQIINDPEAWLHSRVVEETVSSRGFAIPVTDRRTRLIAKRCLLNSLKKPLDGFVSRNLNRHISTTITSLIVNTGIRPNQLTLFIMLIGILSGVFAAMADHWWALILAGCCFQGQSVMDGCDGEIARITYRFSKTGQWLDTIGDDLTNYAFYAGLSVGLARVTDNPLFFLIGGITFVFQWATSITMYQRIYKMGTGDLLAVPNVLSSGSAPVTGWFGRVIAIVYLIVKKDSFALILSVIIALQYPLVSFIAMTIGTYPAFFGIFTNELRIRKLERSGHTITPAN
jgi:phosphatidylglycerophosphate synthase